MANLPLAFRQIHLDFHTSELIPGVGAKFDPEEFVRTLKAARVNSITCFSRCHHGMIYHDTKFPARHPHLQVNLLAEQIRACHADGIRVPIYISVGLDEYMAQRHPEWLELQPDGKLKGAAPLQAGWRKFCLNDTPYVQYVIDQTAEVLEMFPTDGLFFDIIHQGQCVCRTCLPRMLEQGFNPEVEEDRKRYAAQVLRDFKKRLTREVRQRNEDCLLFFNSGHVSPAFREVLDCYSHLELESLPSGGWGYDHFPLTVRYARNLGLDTLGMTGKFHKSWADFGGFKNQAALEYECFTSIAETSKCSIGDQLHPSGQISAATYELIGNVYRQIEEREPWCEDTTAVTEIGIYNPEAIGVEDGRVDTSSGGAYRMLLEAHHQFDVIDDECDWSRYRVLIFPDKITMTEERRQRLDDVIAQGTGVILSYESGMNEAKTEFVLDDLGVKYVGPAEYSPDFVVPKPGLAEGILPSEHVMYERGLAVEPEEGTEVLAEVWDPYFNRTYQHFCSHFHTPVEKAAQYPAVTAKNDVIYFAHPIFRMYMKHGMRVYKQLFLNALSRLINDPLVQTNAPTTAHISLTHQAAQNRVIAHLLHYIPERRYGEINTIEDVIPLYNVSLGLRLPERPRRVYLAPTGNEIDFTYDGDRVNVVVPEVLGHQMVVFES